MMLLWLTVAHAGVAMDVAPQVGHDVVLTITDDFGDPRSGQTVRVVHSPGLAASREVAIGITDGRGQIRWTPDVPGVAELQIGTEPLRVRIAPASVEPTLALLLGLLIVAGLGVTIVGLVPPSALRRR